MKTAHMKHILSLEIRGIAPTQYLNRDIVLTLTYKSTDFEFVVVVTTLCVTHIFTVHPNISSTVKTVEVQEYILLVPALGQSECAAVRTYGVVAHAAYLIYNIRRFILEGILHVHIKRQVVAFHLPARGNIYIIPRRDIGIVAPKSILAGTL